MANRNIHNVKLGLFVLAGLLFLILLLYMIGRNRDMFGSTYTLKAKFENVHGLVPGNNVRFSGIEAGTVKKVKILNDTLIEVTMRIDNKMKHIIRKDAVASIGTDGFVGNKVLNIMPSRHASPLAEDGDVLLSKKTANTEEMLETLYKTNNDVAVIAAELKNTVQRVNNSSALWSLLNDPSLPRELKMTISKIHAASGNAEKITGELHQLLADVREGKGSLGAILTDTTLVVSLNKAIQSITKVGQDADSVVHEINAAIQSLNKDIHSGQGVLQVLLTDTSFAGKLRTSLDNIQKGTDGFNQNMEALKHNFLFRGYFRKLEKQEKKKEKKPDSE